MTGPHPPEVADRASIAAAMREELGAIFRGVRRGPGLCRVCTGPSPNAPSCIRCDGHRSTYGNRLADLVVPVTYAVAGQQSGHHMYGYKGASPDNRRDLKYLMFFAMYLHHGCISAVVGVPWSAITFVASRRRPGTEHPVVELAQQVTTFNDSAERLLLDLGPRIDAPRNDGPLADRFVLAERWRLAVRGRHVLVVDDTWVTGSKSQSAAITLKDAGAGAVTIVCVVRWLDRQYSGHGELIDSVVSGLYDALLCPVTGGACPSGPVQPQLLH